MTTKVPSSLAAQDQTLLVHAYLDGELDPVNALSVQRQIESDAALSSEFANVNALQKTLRERFPTEPLPEHLRRRINGAISKTSDLNRPTWRALAASVLLAISMSSGATWIALQGAVADTVLLEVVDSHMRSLLATKPTEVSSSERHIVKPWFNGRIPQAPRVVDLASEGFPIIGARVDVIAKTPVPTLVYTRRLHVISLMALPASDGARQSSERSLNGYNTVQWTDGKTSYWAASDLNIQELETFAKLWRAAPG
jgi:anti-sigma factor RsiW